LDNVGCAVDDFLNQKRRDRLASKIVVKGHSLAIGLIRNRWLPLRLRVKLVSKFTNCFLGVATKIRRF